MFTSENKEGRGGLRERNLRRQVGEVSAARDSRDVGETGISFKGLGAFHCGGAKIHEVLLLGGRNVDPLCSVEVAC